MDTCEFFKIGQNASDFPRWGDENPEQGDTRVFFTPTTIQRFCHIYIYRSWSEDRVARSALHPMVFHPFPPSTVAIHSDFWKDLFMLFATSGLPATAGESNLRRLILADWLWLERTLNIGGFHIDNTATPHKIET